MAKIHNSINRHKNCGCGNSPECESILDIASPIEGQTLQYSETFKAFVNVMPEAVPEQTPQVNSDWNATSGVAQILNKPIISSFDPNDVDFITFDNTPETTSSAIGTVSWNNTDKTLDIIQSNTTTLQVGQEFQIKIVNKSGVLIPNGHIVYLAGAQGNRITGALARSDSFATSQAIAVATEDINNNEEGFVTKLGLVRNINTDAFTEGSSIYLSNSVAGDIIQNPPLPPNRTVRIGYVVRSHATVGSIYVAIDSTPTFNDLSDVNIDTVTNGQSIAYDSATKSWIPYTPSSGGSSIPMIAGSGSDSLVGNVPLNASRTDADASLALGINSIIGSGSDGSISWGLQSTIGTSCYFSLIGGMNGHLGNDSPTSFISGANNSIGTSSQSSTVFGSSNAVGNDSTSSTIGGQNNDIKDNCISSTAFGQDNIINNYASYSFVSGRGSSISANAIAATAIGQGVIASANYSHAEGKLTKASGEGSHAEGAGSGADTIVASGEGSHAEGSVSSKATGQGSHSEGWNSLASGNYSHCEGGLSKATNTASHAEGYITEANGMYSHSEGSWTIASGENAHAEGYKTTAGNTSHAEGWTTNATGKYCHSEGYLTNSNGTASHSEGYQTTTSAGSMGSHAEGYQTTASGQGSHAEGYGTSATNTSHAEGLNSQATGQYSHAEGEGCIGTGQASHAEAYYNRAIGEGSHAEGQNNKAVGNYSHVEGTNNIAALDYQHVEGIYAIDDTGYAGSNPKLFKIGNGDIVNTIRKDIHFIRADGTIGTAAFKTNGTGTPTGLGAKCPAVTPTTPYAWIQFELSDGSIVYMPAWK